MKLYYILLALLVIPLVYAGGFGYNDRNFTLTRPQTATGGNTYINNSYINNTYVNNSYYYNVTNNTIQTLAPVGSQGAIQWNNNGVLNGSFYTDGKNVYFGTINTTNLITNGDFQTNADGWTLLTGWRYDALGKGIFKNVTGSSQAANQTIYNTPYGSLYLVSFTLYNYSTAIDSTDAVTVQFGTSEQLSIRGNGTFMFVASANAQNTTFRVVGASTTRVAITNISIYKIIAEPSIILAKGYSAKSDQSTGGKSLYFGDLRNDSWSTDGSYYVTATDQLYLLPKKVFTSAGFYFSGTRNYGVLIQTSGAYGGYITSSGTGGTGAYGIGDGAGVIGSGSNGVGVAGVGVQGGKFNSLGGEEVYMSKDGHAMEVNTGDIKINNAGGARIYQSNGVTQAMSIYTESQADDTGNPSQNIYIGTGNGASDTLGTDNGYDAGYLILYGGDGGQSQASSYTTGKGGTIKIAPGIAGQANWYDTVIGNSGDIEFNLAYGRDAYNDPAALYTGNAGNAIMYLANGGYNSYSSGYGQSSTFYIYGSISQNTNYIDVKDSGGTSHVYIDSTGKLYSDAFNPIGYTGCTSSYVDGVNTQIDFVGGSCVSISTALDIRLMNNITYNGENCNTQLCSVNFQWNEQGLKQFSNNSQWRGIVKTGFYIAQDVQKYYPNCTINETVYQYEPIQKDIVTQKPVQTIKQVNNTVYAYIPQYISESEAYENVTVPAKDYYTLNDSQVILVHQESASFVRLKKDVYLNSTSGTYYKIVKTSSLNVTYENETILVNTTVRQNFLNRTTLGTYLTYNDNCVTNAISSDKRRVSVTNISIANDFIQTSQVYKSTKWGRLGYNALQLVNDSSAYLNADGTVNDTKHYAYDNSTGGISVTGQTAVCEQSVYELKRCVKCLVLNNANVNKCPVECFGVMN